MRVRVRVRVRVGELRKGGTIRHDGEKFLEENRIVIYGEETVIQK